MNRKKSVSSCCACPRHQEDLLRLGHLRGRCTGRNDATGGGRVHLKEASKRNAQVSPVWLGKTWMLMGNLVVWRRGMGVIFLGSFLLSKLGRIPRSFQPSSVWPAHLLPSSCPRSLGHVPIVGLRSASLIAHCCSTSLVLRR